jgi:hypothetical protein
VKGGLSVVLVWTFYLLPERREGGRGEQQENKVRAAGGGNRSYSTVQNSDRREDGRGREGGSYAKPERESSEGQDRAISSSTKEEREERKGKERSRAGPQMPSLVVVVDVS